MKVAATGVGQGVQREGCRDIVLQSFYVRPHRAERSIDLKRIIAHLLISSP
jgi:hypothetical protein